MKMSNEGEKETKKGSNNFYTMLKCEWLVRRPRRGEEKGGI